MTKKHFLENKNEDIEIVKENVEYTMLNGRRSKYDLVEYKGNLVTVDWSNKGSLEELFKPRLFTDLIHPDSLLDKLSYWVKNKQIPNMIFYSVCGGSGKTSISQVISIESNCPSLCISANIDRGIDAVKEKMIPFCGNADGLGKRKLLFIEEIGDASKQQVDSLKSVHDKYNKNSAIILTTNTMKNLSEPLLTRMKVFDFNKIQEDDKNKMLIKTIKRVYTILGILCVEYNPKDVQHLVKRYLNSYRDLMLEIQTSIFDGKLVVDAFSSSVLNIDEFFEAINSRDVNKLANMSESINHVALMEYLNDNYTKHMKPECISPFIYACNSFQKDINDSVPFLSISFMAYSFELMSNDVKFIIQH